ncbi:MAG: ATP-binding protein [Armatimonadia bacterium]
MSTWAPDQMCPLILNDWPTYTREDGFVELKQPFDPAYCRGEYRLPPNSSRPHDPPDPATEATERPCPLDNPRWCPHWGARMERYGGRFQIPVRSRNPTLEDLPGDIADDVLSYLAGLESNVRGGRNVVIVGPVGAGKTCIAGLVLVTYARVSGNEDARFIAADSLFRCLGAVTFEPAWMRSREWDGLLETPLLVVDDLGTESPTSEAVRNWGRLIDERYQGRLATIITTNVTDLDGIFYDERARSRFMANCQVWRTNRGDMRAVAATSVGEPDGEGPIEPDPARIEALLGCIPWPRTPEEWENVAAGIRARPVPNDTEKVRLLADHGIPAVVTYRPRTGDADETEEGLRSLLLLAAGSDRHRHLLEAIAWRSHAFGLEYPAHFLLRDWRERLADIPWSDGARSRYGIPSPPPDGHEKICPGGTCV